MSVGQAINELAKLWKSIMAVLAIVVGGALFINGLQNRVAAGEKKDVIQDKQNLKQDEILVQLNATIQRMDNRLERIDASLELALRFMGYDKSIVKQWKTIPTKPLIDSTTGLPVVGYQWIPYELFPDIGNLLTAVDDSTGYHIESVTLWDLRHK